MRVRTFLADLLVLLALLATAANAFPEYQQKIPNGPNVPNPCQPNTVWSGVGHQASGGKGVLNPFGIDVEANHENWTVVCPLDSDGDGKTNGQELGDPDCTWTVNAKAFATNLSHPGICEPLNSTICMTKNSWLVCANPFNCPAISQPAWCPRNSASKTSMNMVLNGLLFPITVFLILVLKSLVQELTP